MSLLNMIYMDYVDTYICEIYRLLSIINWRKKGYYISRKEYSFTAETVSIRLDIIISWELRTFATL